MIGPFLYLSRVSLGLSEPQNGVSFPFLQPVSFKDLIRKLRHHQFPPKKVDVHVDKTDTDRDRQKQTETDRDRQRQTETDRDRQRQTETDRDRQRQTETDSQASKQASKQPSKQTTK